MTAGLIQLAVSGVEDDFLYEKPEVSHFKTLHKHHTHFANEYINEIIPNFNINDKKRILIKKKGDFIHQMYFQIEAIKYFDNLHKHLFIQFNSEKLIDFINNDKQYIIKNVNNQDLHIYKNIYSTSNKIIYLDINQNNIIHEIYINSINNDNDNNLIYISNNEIKLNINSYLIQIFDNNSQLIEQSNSQTNIYNFNNILEPNIYNIVINNNIEINFTYKQYDRKLYTLYPNYIYRINNNDLNVSKVKHNLVDLNHNITTNTLDFDNMLVDNLTNNIDIIDIKFNNYINFIKIVITHNGTHNFNKDDYIYIEDNNSNNHISPFNKIYKIDEIINNTHFSIVCETQFKNYNLISLNNIILKYYPLIKFNQNHSTIYFDFNKKVIISLIELIHSVTEDSNIISFEIYGSNDFLSMTKYNIDNDIFKNWILIDTVNFNEKNINISQLNINYNLFQYYKLIFHYEDTIKFFKYINFFEKELCNIKNIYIQETNNQINNNIYNNTNLTKTLNNINLNNIILFPNNLTTNSDRIINNVVTTTNNNGIQLLLNIHIKKYLNVNYGFISNIEIVNNGFNYNLNDIIYVSKDYFINSTNDLIIQLNESNFIFNNTNFSSKIITNDLTNIKSKQTFINLNESILASELKFNGYQNNLNYISLFDFYGTKYTPVNLNNNFNNYALNIDDTNCLFSLEMLHSIKHNIHTNNIYCNNNNSLEHYNLEHKTFLHFNINYISINNTNNKIVIYDYNNSYINITLQSYDYYLVDDLVEQLNNYLPNNYICENTNNYLTLKKTNFTLKTTKLLEILGFTHNHKNYNNLFYQNSNYYISNINVPFQNFVIDDTNNTIIINNNTININNGNYNINSLLNQIKSKLLSEYEILYLKEQFHIKKINFTLLKSTLFKSIMFHNSYKNIHFIINNNNNLLSFSKDNLTVINKNVTVNNYDVNSLLIELRRLLNPINIKFNNQEYKFNIYDTDYFNLIKNNSNILDLCGFYVVSAIFTYFDNNLYIIYPGKKYNINDIIYLTDNNNYIKAIVTTINNNNELIEFNIIEQYGELSYKIFYDNNKQFYDIINNSITSNIVTFYYINTKNDKLYIKNNNTDLIVEITIEHNIYTPFTLQNEIQYKIFAYFNKTYFKLENNNFTFQSFENITILNNNNNNILKYIGFDSNIELVNNNIIYSNSLTKYVNSNSYISDTNINKIEDVNIKSNIKSKLNNEYDSIDVLYDNNKFNILKSNFSINYNNYYEFLNLFKFVNFDENCIYTSDFINIDIYNPLYIQESQRNIYFRDNNVDIYIKLTNYYNSFYEMINFINNTLNLNDILIEYVDNHVIIRKNNFDLLASNQIMNTLGIINTYDSKLNSNEDPIFTAENEPIRNSKILIFKNINVLNSNNESIISTDIININDILTNNNINCKVLKWSFISDTNNRLEIQVLGDVNVNFNYNNSFINTNYKVNVLSINVENAIVISDINNVFYYKHVISATNNNYSTTKLSLIPINNYTIQELKIKLSEIDPNLNIIIDDNKFKFSYRLSGILSDFQLFIPNDIFTNIIFKNNNISKNKYISEIINNSLITINDKNSIIKIKDKQECVVDFYNLYINDNVNYKLEYSLEEFAFTLDNELNKLSILNYSVFINELNQLIIQKQNFIINTFKVNLLNNIIFDTKLNNNEYSSISLNTNSIDINHTNNKFIYFNNNLKSIEFEYKFQESNLNIYLNDTTPPNNSLQNSAKFNVIIKNNKLYSITLDNNTGKFYNVNHVVNLIYNDNYIRLNVKTVDDNDNSIVEFDNVSFGKIYNIDKYVTLFNSKTNYDYLMSYNNSNLNINISPFYISNNSTILNTINFNETNYNNNNIYYSDNIDFQEVVINNDNNSFIFRDFFDKKLLGKINVFNNNKIVSAYETTNFLSNLNNDDYIYINNNIYQIDYIEDNDTLYLKNNYVGQSGNYYYYYINSYIIAFEPKTYSLNEFINYFNKLINISFSNENYDGNRFDINIKNNKICIKKNNFSIIYKNDITNVLNINKNLNSKLINNLHTISFNLLNNIILTNSTNKLNITINPINTYNIYIVNNVYGNYDLLIETILNMLNNKSIFYELNYNNNRFTISNSKYKFKLVSSDFIKLLGFTEDTYEYNNSFTSNININNVINISNFNNLLIIKEQRVINHEIIFNNNITLLSNITSFIKTLKNNLLIIDNGFNVINNDNTIIITNNISFQINKCSNFFNLFNVTNNINNVNTYSINNVEDKLYINEYNNKFYYKDSLVSYINIENDTYNLQTLSNTLNNEIFYSYKDNNKIIIKKHNFNLIFNTPNNILNDLGFSNNSSNLNFKSKTLPIKKLLITQNPTYTNVTTNIINKNDNMISSLTLNNINLNWYIGQTIKLSNESNTYYATIIDFNINTIYLNINIKNSIYNIYTISNLLSYDDWLNNNSFSIINNKNYYTHYLLDIISYVSNDSIFNIQFNNLELYKYNQVYFSKNNIKYYSGINNIINDVDNNYLPITSNSNIININLKEYIIPYKIFIEYENVEYFELYANNVKLINSKFINSTNNHYNINYNSLYNIDLINNLQNNVTNGINGTLNNINLYKNNNNITDISVNIHFTGYSIKPITDFLINTQLSNIQDKLLLNIIQNTKFASNTNGFKSLDELGAICFGGNPVIKADFEINILNGLVVGINVINQGEGYTYNDIITITNIPGSNKDLKISLLPYLPVDLISENSNIKTNQTIEISVNSNNNGNNCLMKITSFSDTIQHIGILNNGFGFQNNDIITIDKDIIKSNTDIIITLNENYLDNIGASITSIIINEQHFSTNIKNEDIFIIKKNDTNLDDDLFIKLSNNNIKNNIPNNYYNNFELVLYYNENPIINELKLYEYELLNNSIRRFDDYLQINTNTLNNELYYINSKNNENINISIMKTYEHFHYVVENNLNNIFISENNSNPESFINPYINNYSIIDNYNNYNELYYYIQNYDINSEILHINKIQYLHINNNIITLYPKIYIIEELINYLNYQLHSLDINVEFNYITLQYTFNSKSNFSLFCSYNPLENFDIIIYDNICYITFKEKHYLNENNFIYIVSSNYDYLNNIFQINYIDNYRISFSLIKDNQYINTNNINIYTYTNSFLDFINIIPKNNNINRKIYKSILQNNYNSNGKITLLDISQSDVTNIIKKVTISVGNDMIDSHTSKYLDIYNQLFTSKINQLYNINMTKTGVLNQYNIYNIPLRFWFCNNISEALPLIALQYHNIYLDIELNEHFGFNTNIKNDHILKFNLLINYLFVEEKERIQLTKIKHDYLIQNIQKKENIPLEHINSIINIHDFINPIKCIIFKINKADLVNASFKFDDYNTPIHNDKFYNTIQKYQTNLTLKYYLNEFNRTYFPYEQKKDNIYIYSFGLDYSDVHPSGSLNFSYLNSANLSLLLKNIHKDSTVDIYCLTHNIFHIESGLGGLKFVK